MPLIVTGTVLALSACTTTSHQSSAVAEVRIGLLGSFSGPGGGTAQAAARGADLAALVINQAQPPPLPLAGGAGLPGLGGARVRIIRADTGTDVQNAPQVATKLVADQRVAGLVSADSAGATALASERTERIGVPFLGSVASADFLTERGLDWYFRVTPSDQLIGESALALISKNGGGAVDQVGIVHAGDQTSNDAATSVEGLANESGAHLPRNRNASFNGEPDARSKVAEVRAAGSGALVAVASQAGDARSLLHAGALSDDRSVAIGAGFTPQAVRDAGLGGGARVLHATVWSQDFAQRNLAASAVASLYQRRFNAPMSEAAAETFTAVLTLAQAVNSARSLDAQSIRTALLGLNVPGRDTIMPWGGIRFDQTGQNVQAAALVERITPDGARVVFPQELAADNT
ncbi:MAG TPA: ABC transporter substrate-binding protein [Actinomycetota bacterium]|nr:ABC transporter substrate-binding protein [Actinomycetota bacterium]